MPGPEGNKNAAKDETLDAQLTIRCPSDSKHDWIEQARVEKTKVGKLITRVMDEYVKEQRRSRSSRR